PDKRTDAFNRQFLEAATYAYRRYQIMVGPRFGVRWMRNYSVRNTDFVETGYLGEQSVLRALMPEYRKLDPREHPFGGYKFVRQFDSMIIEPPVYLAAMLDEFQLASGRIVLREFPDRAAVQALPEKLVFNCTGLGSKSLFDDQELVPVKGQLTFLLPQPEIQYATMPDPLIPLGAKPIDLYMFPRSDGILLGGTHQMGESSLEPDLDAKQRILAGHRAFFDGFRAC
ncbi:MAG TPA: FAD-dependent oxidoreductase, partial [Xanthomonadaceae bacterium]|nr:FAD-dependent oxidoreductase [Xanthomonadaceae bacterium]